MCLKAQINKKPQRRIPLWSKANWDAMKADTVTFCTEFLDSGVSRDLESNWDYLQLILDPSRINIFLGSLLALVIMFRG